jgi:hypothetical protein
MTYQQRMVPFDFSAMANALPQQPYRAQGYSQSPQRYNTASMVSPGTTAQLPASQFGAATMGPVPTQQYYLPQHMHMAQYYQTSLSPQAPTTQPSRVELGYYQSPVIMNQPPHPGTQFYYTPAAPFPGQAPHVQGQFAPGQYGMPTLHQYPDPRSRQLQPGSHEANLVSPAHHQKNGQ